MTITQRAAQSGSAIILAIFVILIISLLGASLVSLQRDSAQSASYEVYAARAYLSAYSASEVALGELFPLNSSSVQEGSCNESLQNVALPSTVGFYGCNASYSCFIKDASAGIATRYRVVSEATCKNTQITTRRQITTEVIAL